MDRSTRWFFAVPVVLAPVAAWAGDGEVSTFDRIITVVSSVIVPLLIALLGHHLGEKRTRQEDEKVRAKSVIFIPPPPPQPKTALNWLAEIGNVAAPTSQLVAPSESRRTWMPLLVAGILVGCGAITGIVVSRLVAINDQPRPVTVAHVTPPVTGELINMFSDHGDHFVRAGSANGLTAGATIQVYDARRAWIGEGKVVELFESLAHVRVDRAGPAAVPAFATFKGGNKAEPAPAKVPVLAPPTKRAANLTPPIPSPQTTARAPAPTPAPTQVQDPALAPKGIFRGEASIASFGPSKRITLYNTGTIAWTNCDLSLPNDSHYQMERMAAGASDGISLMRFKSNGPDREVPPTWLNVKCTEGTARLTMIVKE